MTLTNATSPDFDPCLVNLVAGHLKNGDTRRSIYSRSPALQGMPFSELKAFWQKVHKIRNRGKT